MADGDKDKDKDKKPSDGDLSKKVESLEGQLQQALNGIRQMSEGFQTLHGEISALKEGGDKDKSSGSPKDVRPDSVFQGKDLDTMPTGELVQGIFQGVSQMLEAKLDETLKPVTKRIEEQGQNVERERAKKEYEDLKKKDPTVDKWLGEIKELHAQHPDLSLSKLYVLAKEENPEKRKELEKEMKPADDDKDKEKSPDQNFEDLLFGGMGGSAGSETREKSSNKSLDDAAEDAWNDTFGATSGA